MAILGDICRFQSGGTPSKGEPSYFNGNIPWITTVALNGSIIDERNAVDWITEKAIEKSAAKIVPVNSVMVGTRVGVGKVAINKVPMSTSQDIISLLDIDESKWSKEFICKFILGKGAYLNSQARGATIKGIKIETLAGLPLPDIPIEQQCKIAMVIDAVDNLIALRKEQLAKLDQLVKSRFIELFDNEEYEKVTVSSVLNTGFWLMPATPEFIVDGEVPYITSKNIKSRTIDFDNVKYISREAYQSISANRPTQKGDILVSMIGTLGQTAVIQDDREFYGQNLYLLRLNSSIIDTTYFCEFFNSDAVQHELQGKRNQSTQAYLKANHVEDLVLPLPPMGLQQQFAAFVEQTDKSKLAIQQSLDKLELLKKSLMQEYFG